MDGEQDSATTVAALIADLADTWDGRPGWTGFRTGPAPESFRGQVADREFLLRPGPQPCNTVAGSYPEQLGRLWDELARRDACLPQPPAAAEAERLVAMLWHHRDLLVALLRPLVEDLVRDGLRSDTEKEHRGPAARA